jgi:hypothetical protein
MVLTAEKVAQQSLAFSGRDGEDTKAQIDHIDGTTLVEMPPMAHCRGNRHLARSRHEVTLDRFHTVRLLGGHAPLTKYLSSLGETRIRELLLK